MRVAYIHADQPHEWNSAGHRSAAPTEALNRSGRHSAVLGHILAFAQNTPENHHVCADADVIVLQRGAMPDTWGSVRYWQQRGKLVLADIDDGYPQITAEHPAYAFWHLGRTVSPTGQPVQYPRPPIIDMAEGLKRVDGLTSPSKLILWDWKQRVGVRGAFIPNYLRLSDYQGERTRGPETDGTIWAAWGGSAGHFISFLESGISDALARVLSTRPNVRFVMCGADTRIIDRVPLRSGQKINLAWRPYEKWSDVLANFDVGLIPTAGEFDARRSALKPVEYSLMGVPWLASHNPAYEALLPHGTFVDNTIEAWVEALEYALDNPPDHAKLRLAREHVIEEYDIDAHAEDIVQAYQSLKG